MPHVQERRLIQELQDYQPRDLLKARLGKTERELTPETQERKLRVVSEKSVATGRSATPADMQLSHPTARRSLASATRPNPGIRRWSPAPTACPALEALRARTRRALVAVGRFLCLGRARGLGSTSADAAATVFRATRACAGTVARAICALARSTKRTVGIGATASRTQDRTVGNARRSAVTQAAAPADHVGLAASTPSPEGAPPRVLAAASSADVLLTTLSAGRRAPARFTKTAGPATDSGLTAACQKAAQINLLAATSASPRRCCPATRVRTGVGDGAPTQRRTRSAST